MLEFVKGILESNKNEDGNIDISKVMAEINKEAPKNLVPKTTFNEKLEDIKTKDALIDNLKKDNADIEGLQTKISDYEKDIETLNSERLAERRSFTLKEKLKDSGAKDIDYMLYKLGEVETDEEGNIKDLDNKLKELKESYKDQFIEETTEQADTKGYETIDNGLEDGKEANAVQTATEQFEQAVGIQQ